MTIFVITKNPSSTVNWNIHHTKGLTEIDDLFTALSCYHEFRSVGFSFNCLLLLAKECYWCLIYQMKNTRHCTASYQVIMEHGILVVRRTDSLTLWRWHVWWKLFFDITIASRCPIMCDGSDDTLMIGNFGAESSCTVRMTLKLSIDAL
jgi:hypothetical protein